MVAQALLVLASFTVGGDSQLLCFGAPWCAPCREMQPVLARLQREGYPIRKINVDDQSALAQRYQVQAVPSFILVDAQGEIIDRIDQATSGETLSKMLAHYRVGPQSSTVRGQSPTAEKNRLEPVQRAPNLQVANADTPKSTPVNAMEAAKLSTVRLQVEDEEGHSFGTGTVIDLHGDEALVLTCGHIFRTSDGKGRILMDRFDMPAAEPSLGSLISYDIDLDVALVSMKVARPIQVAKLAPVEYKAAPGEEVFSIGCSAGEPPTIIKGKVNQVDKYLGPPNITASGRPVQGRSGGGLFNMHGQVVGVCSAADPEIDEGLYGALPRVYYELDRNGLSFVYQREQERPLAKSEQRIQLAETTPVSASDGNLAVPLRSNPIRSAPQETTPAVARASHQTASDSQLPQGTDELVCVLKSDDEQKASKVFVIANPSKVLLEYLGRESIK